MDFKIQRNRLEYVKQVCGISNSDLIKWIGVHPSGLSKYRMEVSDEFYQDITPEKARNLAYGTERHFSAMGLFQRVNWKWIYGWDGERSERSKKGEVTESLVDLANFWDDTLFNPQTAKEALGFLLDELRDSGYILPKLEGIGELYVKLYQKLQSQNMTINQVNEARSLLHGMKKCF